MDSFNSNFKSFDDDQTNLPEGFGWEEMEEGIYAKMPAKKKRRRVAAWWWLGASFFGLSMVAWLMVNPTNLDSTTPVLAEAEAVNNTASPKGKYKTVSATNTLGKPSVKTSQIQGAGSHTTDTKTSAISHLNDAKSNKNVFKEMDRPDQIDNQRLFAYQAQSPLVESPVSPPNLQSLSTEKTEVSAVKTAQNDLVGSTRPQELGIPASQDISSIASSELLPFLTFAELDLTQEQIAQPSVQPTRTSKKHADFLSVESLVTVPTALNSRVNNTYSSPWYGFGLSLGYQKQLSNKFSISAQYAYQQVKEEFVFSDRDTAQGTGMVDHTTNYVNSTSMALISSSTISVNELLDRRREYVSYNAFSVHEVSIFAGYTQFLGSRSELNVGLGVGVQYLGSSQGFRLDDDREIIDLNEAYSTLPKVSGTLNGRIHYVYQLSPKLGLTTGVNYSHVLPQSLSNGLGNGMPTVLSGRIGLRWKL